MNKNKGFTLIEILVVIVIIALVASVVILSVNNVRKKSRDTKRKVDLNAVQVALESYRVKNSSYPTTNSEWWSSCTGGNPPSSTQIICKGTNWMPTVGFIPKYISVLPSDPLNSDEATKPDTSNFYGYLYRSDGKDYKLMVYRLETADGLEWAAQDGGTNANSATRYELFSGLNAQDW